MNSDLFNYLIEEHSQLLKKLIRYNIYSFIRKIEDNKFLCEIKQNVLIPNRPAEIRSLDHISLTHSPGIQRYTNRQSSKTIIKAFDFIISKNLYNETMVDSNLYQYFYDFNADFLNILKLSKVELCHSN